MASNVTRDHHNLRRNLNLNDNYISNDGGNEGISIADDGDVTITTTDVNALKLVHVGESTAATLGINENGQLAIDAEGTAILVAEGSLNLTATTGGVDISSSAMIQLDSPDTGIIYMTKDSIMVSGNLFCEFHMGNKYQKWTYDVANYCKLTIGSAGDTELETLGSGTTDSHLTLDIDGDIILDSATGITKFYLAGSTTDYASLTVAANGVTTLTTVDNGVGAAGHLTLDADGDIILDAASGDFLFYDNGDTDEFFRIRVTEGTGSASLRTFSDAADGHIAIIADGHVEFDNCAVGFDLIEEAFSSDVLANEGSGTGGSHDTDIDFRRSNKIYLAVNGSMNDMNLIFPATSGNFLLNIRYDGNHTIDSWKAWASDATAATLPNVLWPGGTEPTPTDTGRDIFSFYWDADNGICYGVASLDFQEGN